MTKMKECRIPLIGGKVAHLYIPYPLSEENFELIKKYLDLVKLAITSDESPRCEDCGKPYEDFHLDVILPDDQWERITGYTDGEGILCTDCIVRRGASATKFTAAKLVFITADSEQGNERTRET